MNRDDAGVYECQATTHPPQAIFVRLKVVGKFLSGLHCKLFSKIPYTQRFDIRSYNIILICIKIILVC